LRLLLDTHIWLWSKREPDRLSRRVRNALLAAENEVWVSPVSTWEILAMVAKGKIRLHEEVPAWITKMLANTREAPLTHEIALLAQRVPLEHPIDRFLVATAQVLGLTLVTADERLLALKDIATLANR